MSAVDDLDVRELVLVISDKPDVERDAVAAAARSQRAAVHDMLGRTS